MISNVYNQDCMFFMSTVEDKFFDLAIVDPDYGLDRFKKSFGTTRFKSSKNNGQNIILGGKPNENYFSELFRISKYSIVWGANNFIMPESEYFIVWDKAQSVDNFASAEYAWTNYPMPAKVFRYSIHKHNADKGDNIHPTMKPVQLYKWILKNYAKPGDKIFDSHMGSQSSRIAAYDMGFDYWGCEIDKDYFDAGCKRFEQFKAQLKLSL